MKTPIPKIHIRHRALGTIVECLQGLCRSDLMLSITLLRARELSARIPSRTGKTLQFSNRKKTRKSDPEGTHKDTPKHTKLTKVHLETHPGSVSGRGQRKVGLRD